jgi:hypothetical protein
MQGLEEIDKIAQWDKGRVSPEQINKALEGITDTWANDRELKKEFSKRVFYVLWAELIGLAVLILLQGFDFIPLKIDASWFA